MNPIYLAVVAAHGADPLAESAVVAEAEELTREAAR